MSMTKREDPWWHHVSSNHTTVPAIGVMVYGKVKSAATMPCTHRAPVEGTDPLWIGVRKHRSGLDGSTMDKMKALQNFPKNMSMMGCVVDL